VVPETDGVKLMKGFTIQLGKKRTDMEQMSMREHPISNVTDVMYISTKKFQKF
jgi:hypothetical protein